MWEKPYYMISEPARWDTLQISLNGVCTFRAFILQTSWEQFAKCRTFFQTKNCYADRQTIVTHPFSIFIWKPPLSHTGTGSWIEAFQAYNEDYALYASNFIHIESIAVIKVVRYGLNLACFPDEHAVELVERQIAKQQERQ
jgi:hypothetical protein